jgi:hypothetical protein
MFIISSFFADLQARNELARMSDRELRDIGLSAYDINVQENNYVKDEIVNMYNKVKTFIFDAVNSWHDAMELRDNLLSKYNHIYY